jgi:hypothetical protein
VTQTKTLGGTPEYDLVMVIGGRGTLSEPWKVKSTSTCRIYTVSAMEILSASYHLNYSLDDAKVIYTLVAKKEPEIPKTPTTIQFDVHPF